MLTVFHTADWHLGQSFFGLTEITNISSFWTGYSINCEASKPTFLLWPAISLTRLNHRPSRSDDSTTFWLEPSLPFRKLASSSPPVTMTQPLGWKLPQDYWNRSTLPSLAPYKESDGGDTDAILIDRLVIPFEIIRGGVSSCCRSSSFSAAFGCALVANSHDPMLAGVASLYKAGSGSGHQTA